VKPTTWPPGSLVGPHRDDLRIRRGERDLRRFGSVGEQRLAGIALRLAEADLLLGAAGTRPVFLLDEIASELDEERAGLVFGLITERGQMVYAAARRISAHWSGDEQPGTARDAAPSLESSLPREFHVESGRVTPA
jgi:recombinational DNA repair ATPase RecF